MSIPLLCGIHAIFSPFRPSLGGRFCLRYKHYLLAVPICRGFPCLRIPCRFWVVFIAGPGRRGQGPLPAHSVRPISAL